MSESRQMEDLVKLIRTRLAQSAGEPKVAFSHEEAARIERALTQALNQNQKVA